MLSRELRSPMTVDEAIAAVRYEVPASHENVVKLAVMSSIFDGGDPSGQNASRGAQGKLQIVLVERLIGFSTTPGGSS